MQPDFKSVFGLPVKIARHSPWLASVGIGLKIGIVYAPTTFIALVLLPLGILLVAILTGAWGVIKGFVIWVFCTLIVLVLGFAGALRLEEKS